MLNEAIGQKHSENNFSITYISPGNQPPPSVSDTINNQKADKYYFNIVFTKSADFNLHKGCILYNNSNNKFFTKLKVSDSGDTIFYAVDSITLASAFDKGKDISNPISLIYECPKKREKAFAIITIVRNTKKPVKSNPTLTTINKNAKVIDSLILPADNITNSNEDCSPKISGQYSNSLYLQYDPCCNCLREKIPKLSKGKAVYEKINTPRLVREDSLVYIDIDTLERIHYDVYRTDQIINYGTIRTDTIIKVKKIKLKYYKLLENPKRFYAKYGYPITFRVMDINPYKYDVTISESQDDVIDSTIAYSMYNNLSSFISKTISATGTSDSTKKKKSPVTIMSNKDSLIWNALIQIAQKINIYKQLRINSGDCVNMAELSNSHRQFLAKLDQAFIALKLCDCSTYSDYFNNLSSSFRKDTSINNSINKLLLVYNGFYNMNFSFTYNVPQVQNKDEIYFTLDIKPKAGINQGLFIKNEEIHLPIRGGFKIDGSIGLFWDNFRNVNYSYKPETQIIASNDTVHGYRVIGQNNNVRGEFGALALSHFYFRTGTGFNLGLSGGAGLTFASTPRPRYFLGGSFLFGKSSRAVLTTGIVFGETTQFKPYVNYNSFVPTNNDSDNTYKRLDSGLFISFTYNLPFTKSKQSTGNAGKNNSNTKGGSGNNSSNAGSGTGSSGNGGASSK